jgi:uncharacterized MAPEG superfamily protein
MDPDLTYLAWTAVLGLVQVLVTAQLTTAAYGLGWNIGARDEPPAGKPSVLAGRMERATKNLLETFPFAAAAILIAHVAGRHGAFTGWGAALYFWGRLVYVPLYAAGVPFLRSIAWGVSVLGIVLVLVGLAAG